MLYLSSLIGVGTKADPFRPPDLEQPGSGWIDLRPDCAVADGYGIVYLPTASVNSRLTKLADSPFEPLSSLIRSFLSTRLEIALTVGTLGDTLGELLLSGRMDGTRWRPLRATGREYQIWLGVLGKIWAQPVMVGGATDDFERASLGANWTTREGTATIHNSSDFSGDFSGDNQAVYTATTFANDQYSESIISLLQAGKEAQATCRSATSGAFNRYGYAGYNTGADLYKVVASSYTFLQATGATFAVGDTIRIEAEGSTLRGKKNGVQQGTNQTDTSLTSGYPGAGVWHSATPMPEIESWAGADLAAVAGRVPLMVGQGGRL